MDDDMVPLTGEVLPDWIFGSILHSLGRARRGLGMVVKTGEGNSDLLYARWKQGVNDLALCVPVYKGNSAPCFVKHDGKAGEDTFTAKDSRNQDLLDENHRN